MSSMNEEMRAAEAELRRLLESNELTSGMYVRVRGDHLIAGRKEPTGPAGMLEEDDRVRFTQVSRGRYGLSVKRHTGRWEKTPFLGSMRETLDAVCSFMQHLVAPY
jgi:hypothetical protein